MEYCGFSIVLEKQRAFEELPIQPMQNDVYSSERYSRKSRREALTSTATLEVHIEGYKVVNSAFLYELRIILEEFANKRLGEYKPNQPINSVFEVFEDCQGDVLIQRIDTQLIISQTNDADTFPLVALNVIGAKTLASILARALQLADF